MGGVKDLNLDKLEEFIRAQHGNVAAASKENLLALIARARELEGLSRWVISRWDAEVATRPQHNLYRRTLDDTWRQVYRHVTGGEEMPRPYHD